MNARHAFELIIHDTCVGARSPFSLPSISPGAGADPATIVPASSKTGGECSVPVGDALFGFFFIWAPAPEKASPVAPGMLPNRGRSWLRGWWELPAHSDQRSVLKDSWFGPQNGALFEWLSRRYCFHPLQPGPRTTRPGNAPVCSPLLSTSTPLTNTSRTPVEYWCGFSKVA